MHKRFGRRFEALKRNHKSLWYQPFVLFKEYD